VPRRRRRLSRRITSRRRTSNSAWVRPGRGRNRLHRDHAIGILAQISSPRRGRCPAAAGWRCRFRPSGRPGQSRPRRCGLVQRFRSGRRCQARWRRGGPRRRGRLLASTVAAASPGSGVRKYAAGGAPCGKKTVLGRVITGTVSGTCRVSMPERVAGFAGENNRAFE